MLRLISWFHGYGRRICIAIFFALLLYSPHKAASAVTPDWASISNEPFNLIPAPEVTNPVMTASDVTDVSARFVADPFILVDQGIGYMFFEVFNDADGKGIIGLATSSDGLQWQYEQIVLTESVHLSYPLVLSHENEYYMIPESAELNEVRVYRATNFPYDWEYASTIACGRAYVDPTLFFYNQKWWMFVGEVYSSVARGTCRLFYSDDLLGGWVEHPQSPIVKADTSKSRPAGRSFVFDNDRIIRLAQKNNVIYGQRVRAFEVDVLSETQYAEHEIVESPILYESGTGWNASGMHQFDPWWTGDRWLGAVDGNNDRVWSIGIYTAAHAPEITTTPDLTATVAALYIYDIDADGNPAPEYFLVSGPPGMTIDPDQGNITWLPDAEGFYQVQVEAFNSAGFDTQSFHIEVNRIQPIIHTIYVQDVEHGQILPPDVQHVLHGDSISFSILADTGFQIQDIIVDGQSKGASNVYTFVDVEASHTISVVLDRRVEKPVGTGYGNGDGTCFINAIVPMR
jgi:hypothetical protein